MQVNVEQSVLTGAVKNTLGVVDSQGPMPILGHCLVEVNGQGLLVSATDLEVSFRGAYPAEVREPGAFTVHARTLHSLVKDLPKGLLEFSGDDNRAKLEVGESRYEFNVLPAEQFPPLPEVPEDAMVGIETKPFMAMIQKTLYAVATGDLQYHLSCVLLEKVKDAESDVAKLRMVATDGYRLSWTDHIFPGAERLEMKSGILISAKSLRAIQRFLADNNPEKVEIGVVDQAFILRSGDKVFTVRLLDKKFPDYSRTVPDNFAHQFTFNRQDFLAFIKRLTLLTRARFKRLVFTFSDNVAEIVHDNPESGKGREVVALQERAGKKLTEPLRLGLNAKYLLDVLGMMVGETVTLAVNGSKEPVRLIDSGDPNSVYVVMGTEL
jgi:DNA polymerase-3 subunit beta